MFDFRKMHMKEEKDITSMKINKGCWKVDEMCNNLKSVLDTV